MRKNILFVGLIPLFIQWTDMYVFDMGEYGSRNMSSPYQLLPYQLLKILRPDVIYFTVIQDDEGLQLPLAFGRTNILVMSAGGFGHIPIPLIKGEIAASPLEEFKHDVGFFGSVRRTREK